MFAAASAIILCATSAILVEAATSAQIFSPPAACPACTSGNYTGANNGSLPISPLIPGKAYNRFIQIWLENTDFSSASANPTFQALAKQGILLTDYNGVTHPSEPNYIASIAGDFFGLADDNYYYMPKNVSSMVDVLEAGNVSWATYQENMPTDAWPNDYAQKNYLNASAGSYTYYKRKHNPFQILNSVASVPSRAKRIRNFNDFAVDLNASAIPQWVYVSPNLVNDAHDTTTSFVGDWLNYWLMPLLNNTNFNSNETLILVTFDENETYSIANTVYTLLLGSAIPDNLRGTNDTSYYTHYSSMSSVQNNWGLGNLGRGDTNSTMARVFEFQANKTGYQNSNPSNAEIPQTNLTGIFSGPCNNNSWTPVSAPNMSAIGAGGGPVFYVANITNTSFTAAIADAGAINLTSTNSLNPITLPITFPTYISGPNTTQNGTWPPVSGTAATNTSSGSSSASSSVASASATAGTTKSGANKVAVVGAGTLGSALFAFALLL